VKLGFQSSWKIYSLYRAETPFNFPLQQHTALGPPQLSESPRKAMTAAAEIPSLTHSMVKLSCYDSPTSPDRRNSTPTRSVINSGGGELNLSVQQVLGTTATGPERISIAGSLVSVLSHEFH
jgi:hypothetical protein